MTDYSNLDDYALETAILRVQAAQQAATAAYLELVAERRDRIAAAAREMQAAQAAAEVISCPGQWGRGGELEGG